MYIFQSFEDVTFSFWKNVTYTFQKHKGKEIKSTKINNLPLKLSSKLTNLELVFYKSSKMDTVLAGTGKTRFKARKHSKVSTESVKICSPKRLNFSS